MSWKKLIDFPDQKIIGNYNTSLWKIEKNRVWRIGRRKLKNADKESFEVYESNYFIARDRKHIYYNYSNKPLSVDRDSFQKAGGDYWKDKHHIYFEYNVSIKPIKELNVKKFQYLNYGFAFDNNYAYHCGQQMIDCKNPNTLEVIKENNFYAKDIDNIYFKESSLKNVNIENWRLLQHEFSSDNESIYYGKKKLPNVDIKTWEYIDLAYSKDKNKVYSGEQILENELPTEWNKESLFHLIFR